MNPDFADLLHALSDADVRFLVVGAYALALHTRPRATGDLDIWVEPTAENAHRVIPALQAFGAPLAAADQKDFERPGVVFQIGIAPRRIDILTELTGLSFAEAWEDRVSLRLVDRDICFLGKSSIIKNKRVLGRARDLADLELLEE